MVQYFITEQALVISPPCVARAIVVHERADDLGLGGAADSLSTGAAGGRLACCTIQWRPAAKAGTAGNHAAALYLHLLMVLAPLAVVLM